VNDLHDLTCGRYAILYANGGIYSDLDTSCKKPISQWLPPRDNAAAGLPMEKQYIDTKWEDCPLVIGLENDVHFCQWVRGLVFVLSSCHGENGEVSA
jgi:hypothetical protein